MTNDGHYIDDPLDIVSVEPDFEDLGKRPLGNQLYNFFSNKLQEGFNRFLRERYPAVFADFDKMVAHLARVHSLPQDQIIALLACWFNDKSRCLTIKIKK